MAYLGSWKVNDPVIFLANTHRGDTGAAQDADAVPTYRVFEDETTTPLLTGTMALLDAANTTGFYSESITLTAASGFEKGRSYHIYVEATVNGVTGTMHHTFQIEAEVDANTVSSSVTIGALGADAITAGSIQNGAFTAAKFAAGAFQAIWDTLDSAILVANSIGVRLKTFVDVAISSRSTYAGGDTSGTTTLLSRIAPGTHMPQSGDSFPLVDTEVAAIKTKTDQLVFSTANRVDSTVVDKTGYSLSSAGNTAIRDAVTNDIIEVEGNISLQQALSVIMAACLGRTDTGGLVFRTPNGNTVRITSTVNGANERTAITLSPSA